MIRRRGKSYGVLVYDPSIKRKVWVGSATTQADARKLERKHEDRMSKRRGAQTVEDYAGFWLEHRHGPKFGRPSETTKRNNEQQLRKFRKEFGHRRLDEIEAHHARLWAIDHQGSAKVAGAMYSDAVRLDGLVEVNPFANLSLSRGRGRRDIHPVTELEVETLAEIAVRTHGFYGPMCAAWITFAAWTGVRPGEMFALTWDDLDLKDGWVNISAKIAKTSVPRNALLADKAKDAILEMGTLRRGLVFTTSTGVPMCKGSWNYYWRDVRSAFAEGLSESRRRQLLPENRNFVLYELRHFCGSVLADAGLTEVEISRQLGNTPEVCRRYIHLYEDRVTDRLRAAFSRNVVRLERKEAQA